MFGGVSKLKIMAFLLAVFMLGWVANSSYLFLTNLNKEKPFSFSSNEIKSPGDWIKESDVKIRDKAVTLVIDNATWSTFTDTNSMDPVIDVKSHAIKLRPGKASDLQVGDIISYKSEDFNAVIIHRIVDISSDDLGIFFITKGDNNKYTDSEKIRFEQITGVVVGILY